MSISNIMGLALLAAQYIYDVLCLAVHTHVDVHTVLGLCGLYCLPFGDKWADRTVITLLHSRNNSFWPYWGRVGYLSSDQFISYIGGSSIGN